jgi:hypothetical protein
MNHPVSPKRQAVVRRARWLAQATLIYNSLEGILGIGAGLFAGGIALIGFGLDSFIRRKLHPKITARRESAWTLIEAYYIALVAGCAPIGPPVSVLARSRIHLAKFIGAVRMKVPCNAFCGTGG